MIDQEEVRTPPKESSGGHYNWVQSGGSMALTAECERLNPRERSECRWRQIAGALSGLARAHPHPTYVSLGA